MTIWFDKCLTIKEINKFNYTGLLKLLDIKVTAFDDESMTASMPVNKNLHQPFGILHGGASVVLAESVGSLAANLCLDREKFQAVGMAINANHLKSMVQGELIATAKPLHLGKQSQVWSIEIYSDQHKLICISRLTMAVIPKKTP